jgi:hypothetical protein
LNTIPEHVKIVRRKQICGKTWKNKYELLR